MEGGDGFEDCLVLVYSTLLLDPVHLCGCEVGEAMEGPRVAQFQSLSLNFGVEYKGEKPHGGVCSCALLVPDLLSLCCAVPGQANFPVRRFRGFDITMSCPVSVSQTQTEY
jgi:hypothetical protein